MDVSSMLSNGSQDAAGVADGGRQGHQYSTRYTGPTQELQSESRHYGANMQRPCRAGNGAAPHSGYSRTSPSKKDQKHVVFQLIDPEDPRIQARLPMRVMISQHDTTDSIITTVKNFYGLYEYGVSFENKEGISIIAAYDNFDNDMTVYVRTVAQPPPVRAEPTRDSTSLMKPSLGAPFEMRPPPTYSPSRAAAAAKSAGIRSMSPQSELGRRSVSTMPGAKPRTHRTKSTQNSLMGDADGYSSGDNGEGSVTSSRRSKTEQVNAEISVDNIVEGGRRKRAFESSELPLFVPPQVPMTASTSSISPQRRSGPGNAGSPYACSNQQTFSYTQPLPSPQSYVSGYNYVQPAVASSGHNGTYQQLHRAPRGRTTQPAARYSNGSGGVMPTPDPTVGSVISDEDVALQLMRLGDPSAFSHGRTSTSTVDDALSGKAEVASSDDEDEDEEDEAESERLPAVPRFHDVGPQRKKQRTMNEFSSDIASSEEYDDGRDGNFNAEHVNSASGELRKLHKHKSSKPRSNSMIKPKSKPSSMGLQRMPMSPSSLPAQSRKGSVASTINFQHQLGIDEEDLSSKPRCQRCRKSKKGCDRQRPCGRCRDAGIGIDGCQSEDEGNGRKGRYGRHMGVSVKKEGETFGVEATVPQTSMPANGYFLAPALPDKSKKRKR